MKRLRLLVVGHSYILSVNRATAREVARDPSFRVTVVAPRFFPGDLRPLECEPEPPDSPLQLVSVPARWTSRVHVFQYSRRALEELLAKQQFDAIHAWQEPYTLSGYQLSRLARRHRLPFCFYTCQNIAKRYPPPFGFFENSAVAAACNWIGCGKSVMEALVSRGYPADRGRVIPLAVDTKLFQPAEEAARQEIRRTLGLNAPVIGFVGRLVPAKGLRILMNALERLSPDLPWCLLLLGSGEMQPEIERWAAQKGWQDRVRIHLAKHHEVPRYISAMDLVVAPSQTMPNWKEQFGRMLIEAFACGVPVVASDSGEIPFVVGDAGFIVPEKEVSAWTARIEQLLGDSELRRRLGESGIARVHQFSVRETALQFRTLYSEMALSGSSA